ncbi:MAG: hypothetical protein ACOYB3_00120 [Azonexus sp.]
MATQIVDTLISPEEHGPEWANEVVYHGTGRAHAGSIRTNLDIQKGCGYFGYGFYVADDPKLAKSNYADFADDEPVILMFRIAPTAKIADMRVDDRLAAIFQRVSQAGRGLGDPGMPARMVAAGVSGVYDRSVGGLCIYDPKVLIPLGEWNPGEVSFQTSGR